MGLVCDVARSTFTSEKKPKPFYTDENREYY